MKKLLLLFTFLSFASTIYSQDDLSEDYLAFKKEFLDGNFEKAKEVLQEWEKKSPNDPELYCSYATIYGILASKKCEDTDDFSYLSKTAMLPDTIAMFKNMKTKSYRIIKDNGGGMEMFNKAIGYLDKCIREYPDLLEAYYNYMEILNLKKEFKYSTKVAFMLLNRGKENNGAWVDYALKRTEIDPVQYVSQQMQTLFQWSEYELAQRMLDHAISLYPKNVFYLYFRANLYDMLLNKDEAIKLYDQIYALDSDNLYIIGNLAVAYVRHKQIDRAVLLTEKLKNTGDSEIEKAVEVLEKEIAKLKATEDK